METRLLRMFCVIAEQGSLVTAALRLHLTPSALSHGIRSLEAQVGCRLFDRSGKKLLLNQAGEQFLRGVGPPLAALDHAAEQLKHLSKWGQSRLRVGATASICQHLLPNVIRELKKVHDRIELQVQSAAAPDLVRLVQESKVDVAITVTLDEPSGVNVRQLFRDELMLVFAPTHPWNRGGPISTEDIRKQPLILFPNSSTTRRLLESHFKRVDITPSTVMEIDNAEAIKELVKLNLGVSVLAPWTVDKELARASLAMRPLGSRALTRNWSLLSLIKHKLSLPEETFCRICRQQASSMRLDRRDVAAGKK